MSIDNNIKAGFYINDINDIRNELNWRVKIAYTSNLAIFPSLVAIFGYIFSNNLEPDMLYATSATLSIILSIYVNLQIFNRMIEKKIESYILSVQKKLNDEFGITTHSWISYLYQSNNQMTIVGYLSLFYQYFLPNIISSGILITPLIINGVCGINIYVIILTIFSGTLNLLSYILIVYFMYFFKNVRKEHFLYHNVITNN